MARIMMGANALLLLLLAVAVVCLADAAPEQTHGVDMRLARPFPSSGNSSMETPGSALDRLMRRASCRPGTSLCRSTCFISFQSLSSFAKITCVSCLPAYVSISF